MTLPDSRDVLRGALRQFDIRSAELARTSGVSPQYIENCTSKRASRLSYRRLEALLEEIGLELRWKLNRIETAPSNGRMSSRGFKLWGDAEIMSATARMLGFELEPYVVKSVRYDQRGEP